MKNMRHRVLTSIHVHMGVVGKSPQRERNKVVGSVQQIHGRGVYDVQCEDSTVYSTMYSVQGTVHIIQHTVQCKLYTVRDTF